MAGGGCSPDGAGRGGDGADQAPEVGLGDVDPQRGDLRVERPERGRRGLLLVEQRRELDLDGRAGEPQRAPAAGGSALGGDANAGVCHLSSCGSCLPSPTTPRPVSRNPLSAPSGQPQAGARAASPAPVGGKDMHVPEHLWCLSQTGLAPACCGRGVPPPDRRGHRFRSRAQGGEDGTRLAGDQSGTTAHGPAGGSRGTAWRTRG